VSIYEYYIELYDRMTVHRNKFLVNKTNRCTEIQFYWYNDSTCFGQPFCPSSGVLSRTSALVHFMYLWWPFATRSRMELHPTPGSIRSLKLHKMYQSRCKAKNTWWWAERLPETCRVVIPIKLAFSAYVGFIHKELYWKFLIGWYGTICDSFGSWLYSSLQTIGISLLTDLIFSFDVMVTADMWPRRFFNQRARTWHRIYYISFSQTSWFGW